MKAILFAMVFLFVLANTAFAQYFYGYYGYYGYYRPYLYDSYTATQWSYPFAQKMHAYKQRMLWKYREPQLLDQLHNGSSWKRREAAKLLEKNYSGVSTRQALTGMIGDPAVQTIAIKALLGTNNVPGLAEAIKNRGTFYGANAPENVTLLARTLVGSVDINVRISAAQSLGHISTAYALSSLMVAKKRDTDPAVQQAIKGAIEEIMMRKRYRTR